MITYKGLKYSREGYVGYPCLILICIWCTVDKEGNPDIFWKLIVDFWILLYLRKIVYCSLLSLPVPLLNDFLISSLLHNFLSNQSMVPIYLTNEKKRSRLNLQKVSNLSSNLKKCELLKIYMQWTMLKELYQQKARASRV